MIAEVAAGIRTEKAVCDNCGRTDGTLVATGRDHEYATAARETFTFVRCACGLVYLNPRPSAAELPVIYPEGYYAYRLVEQRAASTRRADSLLGRYMGWRAAARLGPYAERLLRLGRQRLSVLDVGCGDGSVLDAWRRALGGIDVDTRGVEMNARAAAIARRRGHTITAARIEETALPERAFDLVCSFHVIEHVDSPTAFLRAMRAALRPDGWALIETPNVDTFDFRLFRARHWGAFHFPRHWTLYDARTFGVLAENAGFDIVDVRYLPSAIHWVWTMHSLLHDRAPRLADRAFPPVDVFLRGSPYNVSLLATFTAVDLAAIAVTGRSSVMRLLLRPRV